MNKLLLLLLMISPLNALVLGDTADDRDEKRVKNMLYGLVTVDYLVSRVR